MPPERIVGLTCAHLQVLVEDENPRRSKREKLWWDLEETEGAELPSVVELQNKPNLAVADLPPLWEVRDYIQSKYKPSPARAFWDHVEEGYTIEEAARRNHVTERTIRRIRDDVRARWLMHASRGRDC